MREWFRFHGPSVGAFLALTVVAGALSLAMPVPMAAREGGSLFPAVAIPLPGPGEDADHDSFADSVDQTEGDLQVAVRLMALEAPGSDARPYVLLGTQDDQWRTGQGAELEWTHVVDPDSLGRRAGSLAWQGDVLRTGAWWMSRPGQDQAIAVAETGRLGPAGAAGAHWPQTLWANVRDDRAIVTLQLELRDADDDPHALRGDWGMEVDVALGRARVEDGEWAPLPANLTFEDGPSRLEVLVDTSGGPARGELEAIARRWAPTLRFDTQEAFVPMRGELLQEFHGFTRLGPGAVDLRTWDFGFNNGRDGYRLFIPDFDGGGVSHTDVRQMSDILVCGVVEGNPCVEDDPSAPTVYANVAVTTDDQVVVQFWFFYMYNFVLDDSGADIPALQHKGDREFVQLTFDGWEDARNGTPTSVAFSQHYEGLLMQGLADGESPLATGNLTVYVARGSHATYPAPGDDRRLRSSLTSLFDRFDGKGRELPPDEYALELLGDQAWHAGYKWGPATRYTRDLGTSARPFLQHDFRYPFTDPVWWQASLHRAEPGDLEGMYGRTE